MQGSYQFEQLEGRMDEAAQLSIRANLRLESFPDLLERHQFPSQGKVLEIGCAQGIRSRILSSFSDRVNVTALDRSPELLEQARQEKVPTNLEFVEGDIYSLPFPAESFDFIYARLVFMHLSRPMLALENILRVLKPGGRLLIEDADRDCMFFEPSTPRFRDFWAKVQEGQRKLGGDPNVGRKLATLLFEAGFQGLNIEAQPILGEGKDIQFLAQTLMPSLNIYLDPADRSEGRLAIEDLLAISLIPSARMYHFWFAVSGMKP